MRALKTAVSISAAALFLAACAGSQTTGNRTVETPASSNTPSAQSTPADELAGARRNFQEYCIRCHKADGTGGPNDFQGNAIKVPNFTTDKMKTVSDATFAKYISEGEEGEMPSFKDKLSPDEIKALIKMIRKDFQKL